MMLRQRRLNTAVHIQWWATQTGESGGFVADELVLAIGRCWTEQGCGFVIEQELETGPCESLEH